MDIKHEIDNIVKVGRSWGMSDYDIKACLLVEIEETRKEQGSSFATYLWLLIKFFVLVPLGAIVLLSFSYAMISSVSPTFEMELNRIGMAWKHPVMSVVRQFKPLASALHMDGYYGVECLVENPYYYGELGSCDGCEHVTGIASLAPGKVRQQIRRVDELKPFIVKKLFTPVNFTQLKQMYEEHQRDIEKTNPVKFETNLPSATRFAHVILEMNADTIASVSEGRGHVYWETNNLPIAQVIRKLFPRPKFVIKEAEVSLNKRIMIDGSHSAPYQLPLGYFTNGWYFQAFGERRVTLTPHPKCSEECKEITVVASAGDVVFFQDQTWRLLSSSTGQTEKNRLSISFIGSFVF